jgi:hypothetical protein
VDLPGIQLQIHIAVRHHIPERLVDPAHFQYRFLHGIAPPSAYLRDS